MAAKIVDLTNPDDAGTPYGSVDEAEQALASMTKKFRSATKGSWTKRPTSTFDSPWTAHSACRK